MNAPGLLWRPVGASWAGRGRDMLFSECARDPARPYGLGGLAVGSHDVELRATYDHGDRDAGSYVRPHL